jgi:hypothetical protein
MFLIEDVYLRAVMRKQETELAKIPLIHGKPCGPVILIHTS